MNANENTAPGTPRAIENSQTSGAKNRPALDFTPAEDFTITATGNGFTVNGSESYPDAFTACASLGF